MTLPDKSEPPVSIVGKLKLLPKKNVLMLESSSMTVKVSPRSGRNALTTVTSGCDLELKPEALQQIRSVAFQ